MSEGYIDMQMVFVEMGYEMNYNKKESGIKPATAL